MAEYIERKVLRKMMQEKYDKLMQEGKDEEIFKGLYSKVYCDGIDVCFKTLIKIIDNMPYLCKGNLETTLEVSKNE